MSGLRSPLRRLWREPLELATYRKITTAVLVAVAAIVVSGAAVRLTNSGMGCPTWPTCEDGSLVPRGATGANGWIEFVNRTFTGAVSIAVAIAVLGARRLRPPRPDLVRLSWGLVAGVVAQALLGGLVVFLHVAPLAVGGHYLLSAVLIANAVVLRHRAGQPAGPRHARATPRLLQWSWGLVGLATLVLITGTLVTGSGPHGGDDAADRLPFAVVTVARVHSLSVWLFLAAAISVLSQVAKGDAAPELIGRGRVLVALIVAQGTLGYVQYAAGVPEGLVAAHVLGSVLVWIAVLQLHLAFTEPATATGPATASTATTIGAPLPS